MATRRFFLAQMAAGGVLLVALVALVIGELSTSREASRPELEQLAKFGTAPEFSLIERSTTPISTSDLAGKVWIADFIYTRCKDTCPLQSAMMAQLQAEFEHDPDLKLVSITVDPLHDSPAVLSSYADEYGAMQDRWLFLTGDLGEIRQLVQEGFRLSAVPVEGADDDPVIFHSSRFVLIDRSGAIRGYYDSRDNEALARLRENARRLLASEVQKMAVAGTFERF